MDNLFEILLPLLVFGAYFLSQLFGKKGGEESEEEPSDELRKIREELRRKIEERRRGGGETGGDPQAAPAGPAGPAEARGGSVMRESQPRRQMVDRREEEAAAAGQSAPSTPTAAGGGEDYSGKLEAQMAEVRRSQEQVEAAGQDAQERVSKFAAPASGRKTGAGRASPANYRDFLREALRDPENLRRSFLLHEVFGTPVGARRGGEMRPSWDV